MFIAAASVREWERRYGTPIVREREQTISRAEMDMVLGSRKHGRSHDITMFIFAGERLALIAKHSFPPGGFRAPSGGLEPGEVLEQGAPREAKEETGLDIALERYVLRIEAVFTEGHRTQPWVSHVFTARRVGGQLEPIDRHEIARATYATVADLQGRIRDILLATERPLLRYRVYLTDETIAAIQKGWPRRPAHTKRRSDVGWDSRPEVEGAGLVEGELGASVGDVEAGVGLGFV